jgi:hypothetical protein
MSLLPLVSFPPTKLGFIILSFVSFVLILVLALALVLTLFVVVFVNVSVGTATARVAVLQIGSYQPCVKSLPSDVTLLTQGRVYIVI